MLIDPLDIAEWATKFAGASQDGSFGLSTMVNLVLVMLLEGMLESFRYAVGVLADLWLDEVNSLDLAQIATVDNLRGWMLPFVALVAVGGILWQGLQMIITRKPQPLVHIGRGIWNTALWGTVAVVGTNLALVAGDGYTGWVLEQALCEDNFSDCDNTGTRWDDQWLSWGDAAADAIGMIGALLCMLLAMIAALIQVVIMLFREAGIVILVGVIQLAAAGSFTQATSGWLKKIILWLLTLVLYKPVAATCYAVGMSLWGESYGHGLGGLRTMFMGLATVLLSTVALPVMAKYFNWTTGALNEGGGFAALAAGAGSAFAAHSMRRTSSDATTAEHVRFMNDQGGPPPPPPPGPAAPAPPAGPPSGGGDPASPGPSGPGAPSTPAPSTSQTVPSFQPGAGNGSSATTTTTATTTNTSAAAGGTSAAGGGTSAAAGGAALGVTVAVEVAKEGAKQGVDLADRAGKGE